MHGQQPGQQEQYPERGRPGERSAAPVPQVREVQQTGEGTQMKRDGPEQQGAHARGELLQRAAADESALRVHGEEVGAPGGRGEREGQAQQRRGGDVPGALGAAAEHLVEQRFAVQDVAEEPAAVHAGGARGAALGVQGAAAQREREPGGGEERPGQGDGEPGPALERSLGEPECADGREAGGARQQRAERPGGAGRDVALRRFGAGRGVRGHAGYPCEQFLGEREDVAVPVAGGGAVGDAVGFEPGGDLQRVDGPFAQLAVPVHQ